MNIRHTIVIVFAAFFVSSCATGVGMFTVSTPPDIIVHVNASGVAGITTPASGKCKISNQGKNGCLHFGTGETGLINFKLTGPSGWAFSAFHICKLNGEVKTCSLNIWERIEFAVTDGAGTKMLIPDSSGNVDLKLLGSGLDAFTLLDQNTFTQDYYYSVDVCNSGTGKCDTADPPIENDGKH